MLAEVPASRAGKTVVLPAINFGWADTDGDNVSQGTLLLSGLEDNDTEGIEGCVNGSGTGSVVTMDLTNSYMFNPELYNQAHHTVESGHTKMAAFRAAVQAAKGDSEHNRVKFEHKESFGKKKVQQELNSGGLRVIKLGTKKNPQLIACMEMQGMKSGFSSPDPKASHVDMSIVPANPA